MLTQSTSLISCGDAVHVVSELGRGKPLICGDLRGTCGHFYLVIDLSSSIVFFLWLILSSPNIQLEAVDLNPVCKHS